MKFEDIFDLSNIVSSFAQSPEATIAGTIDEEGEASPAPEGFAQDIVLGLPQGLGKVVKQEGPKFGLGLATSIPALPSDLFDLNKLITDLAVDYAPKPISKVAEFSSPIADFFSEKAGREKFDQLLNKFGIPSDASDPSQMAGEILLPVGLLTQAGKLKNLKKLPGGEFRNDGIMAASNFLQRSRNYREGRTPNLDAAQAEILSNLQILENSLDAARQARQKKLVDASELDIELINQKKVKNVPVDQSKLDIDFLDVTDSTYPELNYGVKSIHDDPGNIYSDLVKTRPVHFNAEIVATNILKNNPNGLKGRDLIKRLRDFGGISKKELQDTGLLEFENSDDIISFNKNYEGVPGNHLVNTNTKKSIDMTRNNNKVVTSSIFKSDIDSRIIAYDDIIDRSLPFAEAAKLYGVSIDQYQAIITGAAREQVEAGNGFPRIFETSQRIPGADTEEIDYGFLTINSKSGKKTSESHETRILPLDKSRLAHSRFSIRQHPRTGKKYIVPEEWQTDFFGDIIGTKKRPGSGFRIQTGNEELDAQLIKELQNKKDNIETDIDFKQFLFDKTKTNKQMFSPDIRKIFDEIDKSNEIIKENDLLIYSRSDGTEPDYNTRLNSKKDGLNKYVELNSKSFSKVAKIVNNRLEKPLDNESFKTALPLIFKDVRVPPDAEKFILTMREIFGYDGYDFGIGNRFLNRDMIEKSLEFFNTYSKFVGSDEINPARAGEIRSLFDNIGPLTADINFVNKMIEFSNKIQSEANLEPISNLIKPSKKLNVNEQLPNIDTLSDDWMSTYFQRFKKPEDTLKYLGERVNNYEPEAQFRSLNLKNQAKILQFLHENIPGLKENTDQAISNHVKNKKQEYLSQGYQDLANKYTFEKGESEIFTTYELGPTLSRQLTTFLHDRFTNRYRKKSGLIAKQLTKSDFIDILNEDDIKDPLIKNLVKQTFLRDKARVRLRGAKEGPEYQPFSDSKEWVKIIMRDYLRLAADLDLDGVVVPNPGAYMSANRSSEKVQRFYEDVVMNQIAKVAKETGKDVDTIEWRGWNTKGIGHNRYGDQHKVIETDPNLKGKSVKGYEFGGLVGSLNGINVLDLGEVRNG